MAPAKLNLFLEVLNRRDDGFHEIQTVMAPISLFDVLSVESSESESIELVVDDHHLSDKAKIPTDESNLVLRAALLLKESIGNQRQPQGVRIYLEKHIPSEAGLGGASSDAAATLVLLNQFWQAGLDYEALCELASQLGSDVPFFIRPGWAYATGRGEQIHSVEGPAGMPVVIAKPQWGLKTADVYRRHNSPDNPKNPKQFLDALQSGRFRTIGAGLFNRLQTPAMELAPELSLIQNAFARLPSVGHQMTGSGSAYFGLFAHRKAAKWAAACLSNRFPDVTISIGCTYSAGGKLC